MEAHFLPTRAFVLSELNARDKEAYYELLLNNGTKFFQDEAGNYIGSLRLLAPGVKKADKSHATEASLKKCLLLPYEERMANLTENGFVSVQIAGKVQFDYTPYPRFVTLIADTGDVVKPKTRILSWMMKIIEDAYDARFAQEKADADEEEHEKKKGDKGDRAEKKKQKKDESIHMKVFPIFMVRRLTLTMGLKRVVDQTCWDLLYNLDRFRKDYLEVEIFARFLQEFYDHQDLLFYLYVRSVISNVLHISFKTKWTRPEHTAGKKQVSSLWMSYRECMQVSKIVFGEEGEPMMREFITLLLPHMVGQRNETSDTRRIDITQFLHLAVIGYHQAQTGESDDEDNQGDEPHQHHDHRPSVVFQGTNGAHMQVGGEGHRLSLTQGAAVTMPGARGGGDYTNALVHHNQGEDLGGSRPTRHNSAVVASAGQDLGGGGGSPRRQQQDRSDSMVLHQGGEDLGGSPSAKSPTLAALASADAPDHAEELNALQQDRQREFLDYICEPLEDYMHNGAISETDTEQILHSLFETLNDEVSHRVSAANGSVRDIDDFDELLLEILRDEQLLPLMEKERDRLVMLASTQQ
jgi:hypothetical protein